MNNCVGKVGRYKPSLEYERPASDKKSVGEEAEENQLPAKVNFNVIDSEGYVCVSG